MTAAPANIRPAPVPGKGRGMVAARAFAAGEVIELAPTIHLSPADCDLMEQSAVGDYYFAHPADPEAGMVVLGLTSLCNHSDRPNADLRWRQEDGVGWIAELYALAPITTGEEITRRYRCLPWFTVSS